MANRPLLRWFGGKWMAAPWIISHFPPHTKYTEAFGGAASVLVRKPRSKVEVLNDLDDRLFALYRKLYFAFGQRTSPGVEIGDVLPELRRIAAQARGGK